MSLLLDKLFSSVALGHLAVDILNGQRAVLLTFLGVPLGLTNAALGLFNTLYMIAGALSQPLFGFFADRLGPRWMVAGGTLWMFVFFSLALAAPGYWALWLLVIASLGSAAFHPAGTMQATQRGRDLFCGRETTATSYFFLFGQAGHFFGPLIGGPLLQRFGPMGLLLLTSISLPVGLNAANNLSGILPARKPKKAAVAASPGSSNQGIEIGISNPVPQTMMDPSLETRSTLAVVKQRLRPILSDRRQWMPLLAFGLLAAFQSWSQQNMTTFIPKYLSDLGQTPAAYGVVTAMFMGGSAIGNVLGGNLADRFGKRKVAGTALFLATIPIYLIGSVGWSPWLFLLIPLAGGFTGATHSIIVVLAQRMIPSGMALASGLILGFMFSSGALGALLSGYLADQIGLATIFHMTAGIALVAAVLALTLQKT